jgi:hypothetical protein
VQQRHGSADGLLCPQPKAWFLSSRATNCLAVLAPTNFSRRSIGRATIVCFWKVVLLAVPAYARRRVTTLLGIKSRCARNWHRSTTVDVEAKPGKNTQLIRSERYGHVSE